MKHFNKRLVAAGKTMLFAALVYGFSSCKKDNNDPEEPIIDPSVVVPPAPGASPGDPRNGEYAYKLNVIYFIPSDVTPTADYKKRISDILFGHQLFCRKWMKYWGYEDKSFGLPLDTNGLVDIVVVRGAEPLTAYPYATSEGGNTKITNETNAHYAANNLKWHSDHRLYITSATRPASVPFYGLGRSCFAADYPDLSYSLMLINPTTGVHNQPAKTSETTARTVSIGGMLHELGHGLNQPHVGPTYTQRNSPDFGMTLMGSGNYTYGETPTFMHPFSAAILNNCQVSSFVARDFYKSGTQHSLTLDNPVVAGGTMLLSGSFTSEVKVTNLAARFSNSTEGDQGYTSVVFVTKPKDDNTYTMNIPIEEMKVNSFTNYKLTLTMLMEDGNTRNASSPLTYTLERTGDAYTFSAGGGIFNDGTWEVTASQNPLPEDATISNAPQSLVDNNASTSLSMVKPGKSYGGVSVNAGEPLWFTVNFKQPTTFKTVVLTNRNFQAYLNPKRVSLYGSNDGHTFASIKANVDLPNNVKNEIGLGSAVTYQYLKITIDHWDDSLGSTVQIAELSLKEE
jgi:hypothetical protein